MSGTDWTPEPSPGVEPRKGVGLVPKAGAADAYGDRKFDGMFRFGGEVRPSRQGLVDV
jgi:hypothetical protein